MFSIFWEIKFEESKNKLICSRSFSPSQKKSEKHSDLFRFFGYNIQKIKKQAEFFSLFPATTNNHNNNDNND